MPRSSFSVPPSASAAFPVGVAEPTCSIRGASPAASYRAGVLGAAPGNAGSLAVSIRLMREPWPPVVDYGPVALRVCLLRPEAADLLPKAMARVSRPDGVNRGAALCRLKRFDEAAILLEPLAGQNPYAGLFLALAEHHRGNRDRANQVLARTVSLDRSKFTWESRKEFELIRREVENVLTPPRMDNLPPP